MDAQREVIDLREVFASPWEGDGTVELPLWLRWLPAPRRFGFRSEITDVRGDRWTVVDTMTMKSGSQQQRRMAAEQIAPDRVRVTADDMPKGAEIVLWADGFGFTPYVLRTPVLGPITLALHFTDDVELDAARASLVDRIEIRCLGVRVGRLVMHLQRVAEPSTRR